ncbi:MAG: transcriptional regulator [Alphaproteobacteria bacterium PA2]|nr:MAG: transcriptional regulator [Alphaproteobacteria bacterium PA2]
MKWDDLAAQPCSVARTAAVIGDRWTLLILRDCFLGVKRFADFQARLGIARSIVTARLNLLVEEGVLVRQPYQALPARYEYRLTDKGMDLHDIVLAIVAWGDRWQSGPEGPPYWRRHKACGCDFRPMTVCSVCSEVVTARDVEIRENEGLDHQ